MSNRHPDGRPLVGALTAGTALVGFLSTVLALQDRIPLGPAVNTTIILFTALHVVVPGAVWFTLVIRNGEPLRWRVSWLALVVTVGGVWLGLTEMVPTLAAREVRALVYRGLTVAGWIYLLVGLLVDEFRAVARGGR